MTNEYAAHQRFIEMKKIVHIMYIICLENEIRNDVDNGK